MNQLLVPNVFFLHCFPHILYFTTERYLPGSQPPKHKLTVFASNKKTDQHPSLQGGPRADDYKWWCLKGPIEMAEKKWVTMSNWGYFTPISGVIFLPYLELDPENAPCMWKTVANRPTRSPGEVFGGNPLGGPMPPQAFFFCRCDFVWFLSCGDTCWVFFFRVGAETCLFLDWIDFIILKWSWFVFDFKLFYMRFF